MNIKKNKQSNKSIKKYLNKLLEKTLKHKFILMVILFFFLINVFFIITKYYLPDWDDSVYLGMGKYIYSAGQSGLWETFRPLGIPIIIGFGWAMGLRDNSYIVFSQIIALLFSTGIIFMTYFIAKKLFGKTIASFSVLIMIFTPIFIRYSAVALTDIPSAFLVLVSIYMLLKQRYFIAGIFAGLSFLFKFSQGVFVLSVLIFAFYFSIYASSKNKYISFKTTFMSFFKIIKPFITAFIIILLPYLIFNLIAYYPHTHNNTLSYLNLYSIFDAIFTPLFDASKFQNNPFLNTNITDFSSLIYYIFFYPIQLFKNNILYSFVSLYVIFSFIFFFLKIKNIKTSKSKYLKYEFKKTNLKNKYANRISYDIVKPEKIFLLINLLIFLIYFSIMPLKQDRFVIFFAPIISIFVSFTLYSIFYFLINLLNAKNLKRNIVIFTLFLFSLLIVFSVIFASTKIMNDYSMRINKEPLIVKEYYRYFENNDIKGTILTSDPILAAYNENKFIEFFNEFADRIDLANDTSNNIQAIVYVGSSFPCLPSNLTCPETHRNYFENIYKNNYLVFNNTYLENTYYIFLTET